MELIPEVIYRSRFNPEEIRIKNQIWQIICGCYLQKFIQPTDTVLDIGAGCCEFINNINCKNKVAVDLNKDISKFANKDVRGFISKSSDLKIIGNERVDVVFISNLLEHLESKAEICLTLSEAKRVLRPKGKIIIIQPNIRFTGGKYWDFFDHNIPLTDRSIVEILTILGFNCIKVLPKFLPYTTKSRMPKIDLFVKVYLKITLLQKVFGKQMLVIAEK